MVLLTAIISLYLFRGYATFIRAEKKAGDYLRLAIFAEQKIWDMEVNPGDYSSDDGGKKQGQDDDFSWSLDLQDVENDEQRVNPDFSGLQRAVLRLGAKKRKNISLDMVVYLLPNSRP